MNARNALVFFTAFFISGWNLPGSEPSKELVQRNWPQWRGPHATGVAPHADPPLRWSETKNVKWKTPIPGLGTGTPIVWQNQVFVLTAIPTGKKAPAKPAAEAPSAPGNRRGGSFPIQPPDQYYQFALVCLDRATGKILWQKVAREEVPHEGHHKDHSFASASAVTDGEVVLAYFGSRGLYCYDLQGNLQWERDFGDMTTKFEFGEGSSPALSGNIAVVVWDHEGEDFIVAVDKRTGKTLWQKERDETTGWATPLVVEHEGRKQVVVNADNKVCSYDLQSGDLIWETSGQTANAIPTAISQDGLVYVMSGFRSSTLHAIRLGKTGALMGTDAIAWSHNKNTPYVPSPLLYQGLLYFISGNNAMISCLDAKTGRPHYEAERVEGIFGIYASPVGAAGKIYIAGRDGNCAVLKHGPQFEILAQSKLDDKFDASPAAVGRELFLRGHQFVYCIAETE